MHPNRVYTYIGIGTVVIVAVTLSVTVFLNMQRNAAYLVISHNDAHANGGPITIYNLDTEKTLKPRIPMIGCNGIDADPLRRGSLIVYCLGSKNTNNLWSVKVKNGEVKEYPALKDPYQNIDVLLHPKLITGTNGWKYLNGGGPGLFPNGNLTNAYIVGTKDGELFQVPISDASQAYFILRMVLDEETNKLWVMSAGNNTSVLIDRIDLIERKVDFSHTLESYSGFDMKLIGNNLVTTTYRTRTGVDMTVFNRVTGEKEKEITLPVQNDVGFNALSLLQRNGDIFVSNPDGLYVLNKDTYEIKEFLEGSLFKHITFLTGGADAIYAIRSYDQVIEIPDADMHTPRILLDATGQGLVSLYYFINK